MKHVPALTPEQYAAIDERVQERVRGLTVAFEEHARIVDGVRIITEEFLREIITAMIRARIFGLHKLKSKRKMRRQRWKGISKGWLR